MKKRRLGISLYPERGTFEQDVAYMEKAAKLGFDVLFIALLGAGDRQQTIDRYKPLLAKAKELGFEIEADVNPMMFKKMGINASFFSGPLDLSFFTELQVDILRLDLGMNDIEEAYLTKNKDHIKICVNGCNTMDHVGHVLAAGADPDMLLGCHNYYPHRYTGVSLEHFEKGSAPMVKHNLRLQSFVTSQNPDAFGPWPVTEGLPTMEMHRDWPIEAQVKLCERHHHFQRLCHRCRAGGHGCCQRREDHVQPDPRRGPARRAEAAAAHQCFRPRRQL